MDTFLDRHAPRILRCAGRIVMVVTSALMALCLIGAITQPEAIVAWLLLLAGDAFLCWIGWLLTDTKDGTP